MAVAVLTSEAIILSSIQLAVDQSCLGGVSQYGVRTAS